MTPQSWHGKSKIDKTRAGQATWVHFLVSITFFVLTPKFWSLLHCLCAQRTLRSAKFQDFDIFWKSIMACYKWGEKISLVERNQYFKSQPIYHELENYPIFLVGEWCLIKCKNIETEKMHPSCLTSLCFVDFWVTMSTLKCHNLWMSYQFVLKFSG